MKTRKRLINAAVVCLYALAIILTAFLHDTSLQSQKMSVRLEELNTDEGVLAVRYENWAWGHQNYLLVINKEGRCKFLDLGEMEVWEEDLLSFMDTCMADDNIPYLPRSLNIKRELLEKLVSVQDFKLKNTGERCDAGDMSYYSVYVTGNQRKLACMQTDGDFECRSRFREAREICKEMYELYKSGYRNG